MMTSEFFKCNNCLVYFETYAKATIHLGLKHSDDLLNVLNSKHNLNKKRKGNNNKSQHKQNFIEAVSFPDAILSIENHTSTSTSTTKSNNNEKQKPRKSIKHPSTKAKKRNRQAIVPGRLEIKLDTLKASEIERLIQDLYTAAASTSTSKNSINVGSTECPKPSHDQIEACNVTPLRKSRRQAKPIFPKSFGELDSEDEEIIRTGSSGVRPARFIREEENDPLYNTKGYSLKKSKRVPVQRSEVKSEAGKDSESDENDDGEEKTEEEKRKGWACRVCEIFFLSFCSYKAHIESNHYKDNKFICPTCKSKVKSLTRFHKHIQEIHSEIYKLTMGAATKKNYQIVSRFQCDLCAKRFLYEGELKSHIINVHPEHHVRYEKVREKKFNNKPAPYTCPICYRGYISSNSVKRHLITHLEQNPFVCKYSGCGKKFNGQYNLMRHVALHTNREVFKCEKCPASYCRIDRLNYHVKKYHSSQNNSNPNYFKLRCRKRTYQVKRITNLTTNPIVNVATTSQLSSSSQDNQSKSSKPDLDDDTRFEVESVHFTDKIYKTEDGQHSIHVKGEVLSPQKNRTRSRSPSPQLSEEDETSSLQKTNFSKRQLDKQVNLNRLLKADPRIKKLLDEKPEIIAAIIPSPYTCNSDEMQYTCELCQWSSSKAYFYQNHMKKVHGQTVSAFPSNNKKDKTNGGGTSVVEEDLQTISLSCGSCGYHSKSAEDLADHITKAHKRNNKFPCNKCPLGFKEESSFNEHMKRVHLSNKKHACDQCNAKFLKRWLLNAHKKMRHSTEPEKQQTCPKCDRVLKNKKSLLQHDKNVHNKNNTKTCEICNQRCADIHSLRRHIRYVHLKVQNPYNERRRKNKNLSTNEEKNPKNETIEENQNAITKESDATDAIIGL